MTELWLKYGDTSVVVDIKYENLLAHLYPTPSGDYMAEQQIEDELSHLTLCSSLNSLWNVIHLVKNGGQAALLSENSMGLGCEALEMYVQERLDIQTHLDKKLQYLEGLEHVLFLHRLAKNYDLGIVSTLPEYY